MSIAVQSFDQMYGLRGLDMITPDQIIDDSSKTEGRSPYLTNCRLLAPQTSSDPRVAVQSRRGAGFYTQPVGEALGTVNTSTTGASDQNVSYLNQIAQQFTPSTNNALDGLSINIKNLTSNDAVVISVYTNSSGALGTLIAQGSLQSSSITSSYQYVKTYFNQAPVLSTGSSYWIVITGFEPTVTGNYAVSRTSTGSGLRVSVDNGSTWMSTTGSINFQTFQATPGGILGQHRFVTKAGLKQTLFAHGTSIYRVTNESTGAITAIASGLTLVGTKIRFRTVYDKVYITGFQALHIWDGSAMTAATHTVDFPNPDNVIIYHDRAWYYSKSEPTKLYFSNIYPDLLTVPSVNFQYVPDTASPDPLTGFLVFQDQLVLFTKESKYLLLGDDVSTLGLAQSPGGTKGAVSQEAIGLGETVVYFWSQDGGAYYYDGAQDKPIGDPIQPQATQIVDVASIDSIVTDKEWRIYFKNLGDSTHQRMLLYDTRYGEWLLDTETSTRFPVSWSLENNELVEASSTMGALYFGESSISQLGAPIKWRYWTNYKKYTSGIAKDRVKTFRAIFASPDRTFTVKVGKDADFDNAPSYKRVILTVSGLVYDGGALYDDPTSLYGKGSRVSQPKVPLSGRANNSQYRFEKDVLYTEVRLYGYEAIVKSGRPR